MTAAEWLRTVSDAARMIHSELLWEEAQRNRALSLSAPQGIGGGSHDKMHAVDVLIDVEMSRSQRLAHAFYEINQAREVFEGMKTIGMLEGDAARIFELVHINLIKKTDAANALNMSLPTLKRRYAYGVDWLDAHGLAHAKAGIGRAT